MTRNCAWICVCDTSGEIDNGACGVFLVSSARQPNGWLTGNEKGFSSHKRAACKVPLSGGLESHRAPLFHTLLSFSFFCGKPSFILIDILFYARIYALLPSLPVTILRRRKKERERERDHEKSEKLFAFRKFIVLAGTDDDDVLGVARRQIRSSKPTLLVCCALVEELPARYVRRQGSLKDYFIKITRGIYTLRATLRCELITPRIVRHIKLHKFMIVA